MRAGRWLLVSAMVIAGCFEEGGDTARNAAAITTAQGLIAFGDIQSNITTDPAKAGEALLEFIKWPVAADSLISPPFEGAEDVMNTSPRLAPTTPVPDCLLQHGEPACESYSTTDTCEAGGFTFRGYMNRKCAKCDDPRGLCSYGWLLPELKYVSTRFTLSMSTSGSWTGTTFEIYPNLSARYDLNTAGSQKVGSVTACACSPFTVEDGPPPSGKPRKLINSSFVVRALASAPGVIDLQKCARVVFDGNGNVSVESSCTCANGNACRAPDPASPVNTKCGDGFCEQGDDADGPGEDFENCPVDCPLNEPECPNGVCEIGEDVSNCPGDCDVVP